MLRPGALFSDTFQSNVLLALPSRPPLGGENSSVSPVSASTIMPAKSAPGARIDANVICGFAISWRERTFCMHRLVD